MTICPFQINEFTSLENKLVVAAEVHVPVPLDDVLYDICPGDPAITHLFPIQHIALTVDVGIGVDIEVDIDNGAIKHRRKIRR